MSRCHQLVDCIQCQHRQIKKFTRLTTIHGITPQTDSNETTKLEGLLSGAANPAST